MRINHFIVLLALGFSGAAQAALMPPPGFTAPVNVKKNSEVRCEAPPPPFTAPLDFPSKYEGSDKARDKLNPDADKRYKALTEPIHRMERDFSSLVGKYLRNGKPDLLACAVNWMQTWSAAGALEGEVKNHTGKAARKWALASLSSSWLRLKFSSSQPLRQYPRESAQIEAWLGRLGRRVVSDWSNEPLDKVNNHEYWAAWGAMATAVVIDDRSMFDWAVSEYRTAAKQVDADGYLPNELKRETRALAYHNYSLGPLAMIAAFAKANGVDLANENDRALQRLAERVLAGVDDPRMFQERTAEKQVLDDLRETSKFSWLEPYCWVYSCQGAAARTLAQKRPLKTYRLGGNLTDIFSPAPPKVQLSMEYSS